MRWLNARHGILPATALLTTLPARVAGGDVLSTDGFTTCMDDPSVQVTQMNIQFDRSTNKIVYDVAGTSSDVQNVTASMAVSAYGKQVYQKDFDPCDRTTGTFVAQLCPVPQGSFAAHGDLNIPTQYSSMIPSIAFTVPDLDGQAKLELKNADGQDMACIQSSLGNGKTLDVPAVKYVAAGIAVAALLFSGISSIASGGNAGAATPSPSFGEVIGWFQGIATSGMFSVSYPSVYKSFTGNFGFSTGLVPWSAMQTSIDNFRATTGGNLTNDNYQYLRNATIVETANGNSTGSNMFKRGIGNLVLFARDVTTEVNGTSSDGSNVNNGTTGGSKTIHYVTGIQAYVEELMIPQANTFMTVLLVFAIVVAAITVLILLFKVILEAVSMVGKLPKSLESWRKRYWWRLAKAIVNLILLLYGTWTLYCIYQFTNGDSWAAKVLAAVTWVMFTGILAFFIWRIWSKARAYKKADGNASALFEDKETWVKYSLFYDSLRTGYWWLFVPAIVYVFARNAVIAAANGHGMVQAIGQMAIEAIFLALLVWTRPYTLKSGNIINIVIQVVRILTVICVLVFVEELGISQTTKTITGVILIVVQSVLTAVLAILIAVNALISLIRENPHRRRRKEAEKLNRDMDNLTPLDARNSLLISSKQLTEYKGAAPDSSLAKAPLVSPTLHGAKGPKQYAPVPGRDTSPTGYYSDNDYHLERPRGVGFLRNESSDNLVSGAASMAGRERSQSPRPRLPEIDFGHKGRGF